MNSQKSFTSFDNINDSESPILGTQYIVEKNDNLYNIAARFNTTYNILKKINNLKSDKLVPGQIIIVDDLYTPGKEIYKEYIVKPNDNIYEIAFSHDMTDEELKNLNLLEGDKIIPGQVLIVNNVEESNGKVKYKTESGDSLWSIAKKYNTTVEELKKLNNLKNNNLHIGDELVVIDLEAPKNNAYIVMPGDTLYGIASKTGTTVDELKEANNLSSDKLSVGQMLSIPSS